MTTTGRPGTDSEPLRSRIAAELDRTRSRTALLTDAVDDDDLMRQHSTLMSPLVWDLAHVGNQEELWLVRDVGGREPVRRDIDDLYDAFKQPRRDRPSLPLLPRPRRGRTCVPCGTRSTTCSTVSGSPIGGWSRTASRSG